MLSSDRPLASNAVNVWEGSVQVVAGSQSGSVASTADQRQRRRKVDRHSLSKVARGLAEDHACGVRTDNADGPDPPAGNVLCIGQVLTIPPPSMWAASKPKRVRSARSLRIAELVGHHLSPAIRGSPAVCPRHPLGCCGLGRASSPTTPASPPRRTSACHGGAKRLRFGRHREVAPRKGHNFRTTAVLRGFRDQTCPSLENRTEGEDAGIGPAELPRQQER